MTELEQRQANLLGKDPRYERWRLRIFAITWLAYAGFYFTRQAFSVAKVGILDDPSVNTISAGTSAGFINGCGSVGAILGGLLPGCFGSSPLFYGFAGAALPAGLVLLPHWNRRPANG